jgi:hypothetical protein
MEKFWVVTLFHFQPTDNDRGILESVAVEQFQTLGIEEFSLTEAEVDAILGDRS